jgi:hypothetical protein
LERPIGVHRQKSAPGSVSSSARSSRGSLSGAAGVVGAPGSSGGGGGGGGSGLHNSSSDDETDGFGEIEALSPSELLKRQTDAMHKNNANGSGGTAGSGGGGAGGAGGSGGNGGGGDGPHAGPNALEDIGDLEAEPKVEKKSERVLNEWDVSAELTGFREAERSYNGLYGGCFPAASPSAAVVDAPVSFQFMCQQSMLAQTKMLHLMYKHRAVASAGGASTSSRGGGGGGGGGGTGGSTGGSGSGSGVHSGNYTGALAFGSLTGPLSMTAGGSPTA